MFFTHFPYRVDVVCVGLAVHTLKNMKFRLVVHLKIMTNNENYQEEELILVRFRKKQIPKKIMSSSNSIDMN